MNYLYSALVLHKSGKEVTEEGVTAILDAAGVDVDSSRVKALVAALSEVDIDEALESAVMAAPAAPTSASAGNGDASAAKEVEEEEPEEEEEEEAEVVEEGLGSLFG